MSVPKDTPIRRLLRRFALGTGPLKRRSDRIQVIGRLLLVLSFLIAPPLAVAVATASSAHLQTVAATEAAERSRTVAVLLEDAAEPKRDSGEYAAYPLIRVPVRAVWSVPGGTTGAGIVMVPPGTAADTAVPVWVDRRGELTRAPTDRAVLPGSAAAMGALPLVGVPLAAWTLYAFLCFTLDAHRERRWAQDWAAVEPEWKSRLL
jgi:hypothetical protein